MLIKSNYLVPQGYKGLTVWPFVFYRGKLNETFVNHERIHLRQQIELLVLPFFVIYILHYLINFIRYADHMKAYKNIIFEKEAYGNENNLEYLKTRKLFQCFRKK